MKKEFVMRGRTKHDGTEVLNFSGFKPGMGYKLTALDLYPMTPTAGETLLATIVSGKTEMDPELVDFRDQSLIAVSLESYSTNAIDGDIQKTIIDDTFIITQNLILMVKSTNSGEPVNWQCKFEPVKMSKAEEAVTNYKQYLISDGS
jgi:hypothetical protein